MITQDTPTEVSLSRSFLAHGPKLYYQSDNKFLNSNTKLNAIPKNGAFFVYDIDLHSATVVNGPL